MFRAPAVPAPAIRLVMAPFLALALLVMGAGGTLGRDLPKADLHVADVPRAGIGYDISYPQCRKRYPSVFDFGIVGVNGGRALKPNPCLGAGGRGASQLSWAGMRAELYMNTGNPGPELSARWPIGQTSPRPCATTARPDPDTVDCAYDYGWNAAADAYATAVAAYVSLGWAPADATRTPVANRWWLDVETANSWRDEDALNVAALQGAVDYLESMDVESIGFYSVARMWWVITGGTDAFADYPSWVAGAHTREGAIDRCDRPAFTGGRVELTQYFAYGFDANYRC